MRCARQQSKEPAVRVQVSSSLPTGSGLGSSASTMVAAVAAVGQLEGWDLDARSIFDAALFGEKLVHGKPSGITWPSPPWGESSSSG